MPDAIDSLVSEKASVTQSMILCKKDSQLLTADS